MWGNEANFSDVREVLALFSTINAQIDELEKPLQEAFKQDVLFNLQGKSFGSYENNRNVAERLRDLLYRLRLRIQCLKPGCGQPSILNMSQDTARRGWHVSM